MSELSAVLTAYKGMLNVFAYSRINVSPHPFVDIEYSFFCRQFFVVKIKFFGMQNAAVSDVLINTVRVQ